LEKKERLALKRLISELRERMRGFPDERKGKNVKYAVEEAGMATFSVFFMLNPSFLAHQRAMKETKGRNNTNGVPLLPPNRSAAYQSKVSGRSEGIMDLGVETPARHFVTHADCFQTHHFRLFRRHGLGTPYQPKPCP
jgi:hypothetical protein